MIKEVTETKQVFDQEQIRLLAVGKRYAEDPRWAAKVAGCMKIIAEAGQ